MIKITSLLTTFVVAAILVSINTNPSFAQNNALSQSGNSKASQAIEQAQSSAQDSQCVSGDITALSCNNLSFQAQLNANEDDEKPNPNPNPNPNPGDGKVTLCHQTGSQTNPEVTISVSQNAVPAHLAHGDHLGACSR